MADQSQWGAEKGREQHACILCTTSARIVPRGPSQYILCAYNMSADFSHAPGSVVSLFRRRRRRGHGQISCLSVPTLAYLSSSSITFHIPLINEYDIGSELGRHSRKDTILPSKVSCSVRLSEPDQRTKGKAPLSSSPKGLFHRNRITGEERGRLGNGLYARAQSIHRSIHSSQSIILPLHSRVVGHQ